MCRCQISLVSSANPLRSCLVCSHRRIHDASAPSVSEAIQNNDLLATVTCICSSKEGIGTPRGERFHSPMSDNGDSVAGDDGPVLDEVQEPRGTHVVTTMGQTHPLTLQPTHPDENNDCILFVANANLFCRQQGCKWQERAEGELKILENTTSKRVRIIVRQAKTMEVRANHRIVAGMRLVAATYSDNAYVWLAPNDVSDGEATEQTFLVEFDTPGIAQDFKAVFNSALPH
jgi:hypothetical protein